jgi:hypothetical protein
LCKDGFFTDAGGNPYADDVARYGPWRRFLPPVIARRSRRAWRLMKIEHLIRYAPLAVGLMKVENINRYSLLPSGS